jgi:hypothetical protein
MFQFIHRIKFLCTATNQYGIHSPFVYQYLINCLYKRSSGNRSKALDVLIKSIDYFNAESIRITSDQEQLRQLLKKRAPQLTFNKVPYDIIYLPCDQSALLKDPHFISKNSHSNTLVILEGIYKNKEVHALWQKLILLEDFHVSIDFFYCGALFFRNEQEKQHFKIRI